ncbi:hypothetical protein [Methylobacterium sp. Leaf88]|uniref:hypothetical protein n=1 Tax=Methylobacterium sp. Leaf88 TaxID=1736244 RepID=UPI000A832701|nr:hypothetical protein [Methylobacterium sp. Leaf88]
MSKPSSKPTRKPKPPRRLALATVEAPPTEADTFEDFPPELGVENFGAATGNLRVTTLLAMAMIQDAMRPVDLRRIASARGLAVVVGVPGPDWVDPVARALQKVGVWSEVIKRHGASRNERPDVGCDGVAEALGAGHSVCGVSNAPERYLPSNLVGLADIRVDLPSPSPRALRAAIQLATGSRPGPIPRGIATGLPFSTLAGCIRRGSSGRSCVRRVRPRRRRRAAHRGMSRVRRGRLQGLGPGPDRGGAGISRWTAPLE